MADCHHGVHRFALASFVAVARDGVFTSKAADLHIVSDGLGVFGADT